MRSVRACVLNNPLQRAAWLVLLVLGCAGTTPAAVSGADPQPRSPSRGAESDSKDDRSSAAVHARPGTWTATLPGGVGVRLVGITAGPSSVGPWWSPNGTLLASSPYPEETAAERTLRPADYALFGGKPGDRPYFFAYEVTQPASTDVQPIHANLLDPTVEGKVERTRVRCLAFLPAAKRRGPASLSLASTPWQTIVRASSAGGHFAGKDRQNIPYDFHLTARALPIRVDSMPSGTVVRVEWSGHFGGENPWQINVIDRKGQPMDQVIGGEAAATSNYHIEFRPRGVESPTLDQVKEIRVQVRPKEELIFDNVVLQPNTKKDIK